MRKIIHVDMDCFYAAVEMKHRPELRGKPVGVGGSSNARGVLCTASYEARKFGVRSAMSSGRALKLCPDLILVRPNFDLYRRESLAVREIFGRYTDVIQPLSLDEAYLDVSDCLHFGGSATLIARDIRRAIADEVGLPASAGVAPNKFLAKIASDWRKPNGQFVIRPGDIDAFMRELPVEKIWGVGKVTAGKMHELGLRTCADIQDTPPEKLRQWFGSRGAYLSELARGVDDRPVESSGERKSCSVEQTFSNDLTTLAQCLAEIPELYQDWERRMRRGDYIDRLRGIVVKVKFHDFRSTTHEMVFRDMPQIEDFEPLLERAWERRAEPVRLIGIGARLETTEPEREDRSDQLSFAL